MIKNNFKENLEEAKKFHQSGDLISAINLYLRILKNQNNSPELFFYLGTAYLQSGSYNNSIKYLEKSLESEKFNPMIYNNLGIAFKEALADCKGINRFANVLVPMDEALCECAIDICNRPYLGFSHNFDKEKVWLKSLFSNQDYL